MHDLLERPPRGRTWLVAAALTLLIGWWNAQIVWEVSFSILYLLPVGIAAWALGRGPGIGFAIASSAFWWFANRTFPTTNPLIVYWNAFAQFLVFVIVAELLVGLREALVRGRELARVDPLTGLSNPRAFTEIAEREIARARRTGHPLALACIDLTGLKKINAELGHAAGDEMLMLVGRALRASTRRSDLAARLGGDEFAILLPDTDAEGTEVILQKVVDNIRDYAVVKDRQASMSAGAVVSVSAPPGLDELLRVAEKLMYEVKRSGGSVVRVVVLDNDSSI